MSLLRDHCMMVVNKEDVEMKKSIKYIVAVIIVLVIGVGIYLGSIFSKMTVSVEDYPVTLTEEESSHELAKYYDQLAEIPKETLEEMTLKPSDEGVLFEDINQILKADSGFEDGYTVLEDGTGYVAVTTQFPGSSIEMLDWWFEWVGYEPIRYKIWYPGLHSQALYEGGIENEDGHYSISSYVKNHPEGKTKHTIEMIAPDSAPSDLYITFVDPEQFGIDEALYQDYQWALSATVNSGGINMVKMVHFVRETEDGVEMRSRFWMGQDQNWLIQQFASSEDQMQAMFYHCAQEYNQLASFLPEVYEAYGNK